MRLLLLAGVVVLAPIPSGCAGGADPEDADVTIEGVNPDAADTDLAPDQTLQPDAGLAPDDSLRGGLPNVGEVE